VIGFDKPAAGMRIEVHWELLSRNYAIDWDMKRLWTGTETVTLNHTPLQTLAKEPLLLYLCVHGSKHLFERLEWICDIDRLVRTHTAMDWAVLTHTAQKTGTLRMLLLGLSLARYFLDVPLPHAIQQNITKDKRIPALMHKIIQLHFTETEPRTAGTGYFLLLLQMRERLRDKLRFSYRAFFAPQFNDFNFLPLPGPLHFLYPLVRLYRLGKKYLSGK
jgi:hypothetical protein